MSNEIIETEINQEIDGADDGQSKDEASMKSLPLVVGALAEARDLLRALLQGEGVDESSSDHQGRYIAIGMATKSAERVEQGLRSMVNASGLLVSLFMTPGKAVIGSRPLKPVRSRFDKLVKRGKEEVEAWMVMGQETELQGRQMLRRTVSRGKGKVTKWIGDDPAVEELVIRIAENYLAYLDAHPELIESLVREQADDYIDYLNKNPEQVQNLVQGQSTGLVAEVTDQVRERTVTADTFLEMLIRSLFRRGERVEAAVEMLPEEIVETDNDAV